MIILILCVRGSGAAVIQPALLTGSSAAPKRSATQWWRVLLISATVLFTITAILLSYKLYVATYHDIQQVTTSKCATLTLQMILWSFKNFDSTPVSRELFCSTIVNVKKNKNVWDDILNSKSAIYFYIKSRDQSVLNILKFTCISNTTLMFISRRIVKTLCI